MTTWWTTDLDWELKMIGSKFDNRRVKEVSDGTVPVDLNKKEKDLNKGERTKLV